MFFVLENDEKFDSIINFQFVIVLEKNEKFDSIINFQLFFMLEINEKLYSIINIQLFFVLENNEKFDSIINFQFSICYLNVWFKDFVLQVFVSKLKIDNYKFNFQFSIFEPIFDLKQFSKLF